MVLLTNCNVEGSKTRKNGNSFLAAYTRQQVYHIFVIQLMPKNRTVFWQCNVLKMIDFHFLPFVPYYFVSQFNNSFNSREILAE